MACRPSPEINYLKCWELFDIATLGLGIAIGSAAVPWRGLPPQ
jgi:hypothetical protein